MLDRRVHELEWEPRGQLSLLVTELLADGGPAQEVAPAGGAEASGRLCVRRGAGLGLRVWAPLSWALGRGRVRQGAVTQLPARREPAQAGAEPCSVIFPPPPLPFVF